jgi:hypothetical protein
MPYKLPPDIEAELQKRYPAVHIPSVVDSIFQSMIEKITKDSSCTIREFGKFVAFVTHSQKMAKDVIRFRFKLSSSLGKKFKSDPYLLENLPVQAQQPFTKEHEKKCADKQEQRLANLEAIKESNRVCKIKTNEAIAAETVFNIVNSSGAK